MKISLLFKKNSYLFMFMTWVLDPDPFFSHFLCTEQLLIISTLTRKPALAVTQSGSDQALLLTWTNQFINILSSDLNPKFRFKRISSIRSVWFNYLSSTSGIKLNERRNITSGVVVLDFRVLTFV